MSIRDVGLEWYQRLATPAALPSLERMCRRRAAVPRARTARCEQADPVTGGTCVPDNDSREEAGDDRRRGGRRGASCHKRDDGRFPRHSPGEDRRSDPGVRACGTSATLADARDDERAWRS